MSLTQKDILIINDFRQYVYILLKNRRFIVEVLEMKRKVKNVKFSMLCQYIGDFDR